MSQAEELLNTLNTTEQFAGESEEPHIIIDDNRIVTVPDKLKRLAVQYDHDIETVTFDCPRYWDGIDMSEMSIYINYLRYDTYTGSYKAQNVTVDSINSTKMHFDWTISRNVTQVIGKLVFLVCIRKTDESGNEVNHWNSELCKDCYVSEGLEVDGEELKELYPDIIDQWYNEVLGVIGEMKTFKEELIEMRDSGEFDGATFTPSVSETGDLSWTNDRGRENPETVNIRGQSPTIEVTDIQGGHRVTITDINGTSSFDVLDTITDETEAAVKMLNEFIYVGSVEPTSYPVLWFDTNSPWGTGAVIKYINSSGVSTEIDPVVLRENVSDIEELLNHLTDNANPHNVTAAQVGAVSNTPVTATSTDGVIYTATVEGIDSLTAGANFVMIPDTESTTQTPKLNVNGLGEIFIRRRVSTGSSVSAPGYNNEWLAAGKPVRVMYNGLFWIVDTVQAHASDLMGSVPINKGGTGATDGSTGLANLLAAGDTVLSAYQYGTALPAAGTLGRVFFKKVTDGETSSGGETSNLEPLVFTGAVNATYDGTSTTTVNIPSGGSTSGGSLSESARNLLITILRNGVYISDQSANITALETALGGSGESGGETEKTLISISATYSGGDVAVGTVVTDLTGIVVTATYSDGSTATVTDYTMSGEIAEGENTITVTYEGMTTTFTVTGIAESSGGEELSVDIQSLLTANGYYYDGYPSINGATKFKGTSLDGGTTPAYAIQLVSGATYTLKTVSNGDETGVYGPAAFSGSTDGETTGAWRGNINKISSIEKTSEGIDSGVYLLTYTFIAPIGTAYLSVGCLNGYVSYASISYQQG